VGRRLTRSPGERCILLSLLGALVDPLRLALEEAAHSRQPAGHGLQQLIHPPA
jgi:hypothetical protein